jgi:membrane protein
MKAKPLFFFKQAGRWLWRKAAAGCTTIWEGYARFARQHHLLYAAAISYYGIISLVPLLAIVIYISAWAMRSDAATDALAKALAMMFPVPIETFRRGARTVSATSPWAFTLYLFGLLWAAAYLFESIERVINVIWVGATERSYHVRKLIGMSVVLSTGFLLFLSILMIATWAALSQAVALPSEAWIKFVSLLNRAGVLLPLFTSTVMFVLVYKLLPTRRVHWRAALAGGVFSGLFWETSKWLFGWFVFKSGREYGAIYGSLAGVVIIMLWIHISAIILILGAHVACITQEKIDLAAAEAAQRKNADFWLNHEK